MKRVWLWMWCSVPKQRDWRGECILLSCVLAQLSLTLRINYQTTARRHQQQQPESQPASQLHRSRRPSTGLLEPGVWSLREKADSLNIIFDCRDGKAFQIVTSVGESPAMASSR
ncbi:hypothetical protein MPTK1_3g18930 [Marchantia polymorpha subsp. ruderalis]|uniref:Uncharacterized protein n=2 Tax=Marchantia polymorpha TaxID=3197 RepID=A0AAF6B2D0_MARPO|nr:hypothetical protein MARPO_0142s0002 [Marchantia polymorpha]BBN06164.1 hypothetical protein Mp_3g18930 [Marchantia polymorpha subsp. ruderalis]|eukprot:PTQ29370.1 hypothetical protein MARPO_0142s0002 [Marchantia polymorpha]